MENSEINILFGQRVRELRKSRGWSQEDLAAQCGLDRTYISGIERGVRNPTLGIIWILAKNLDVELHVFFNWK